MKYHVFYALHEEAEKGWVWLSKPEFKTRSIIRLCNPSNKMFVFCEYRSIDPNFITLYNEKQHTNNITPELQDCALVISEWYRDGLGLKKGENAVDLRVRCSRPWGWGLLRAGCHHPDTIVRVATQLGILSFWLGVCSLLFALFGPNGTVGISAALLGILCWRTSKGVNRCEKSE